MGGSISRCWKLLARCGLGCAGTAPFDELMKSVFGALPRLWSVEADALLVGWEGGTRDELSCLNVLRSMALYDISIDPRHGLK
jgi:hypothetical protein